MEEERGMIQLHPHPPEDDDCNNRRVRVCHLCNKRFSSGKALGGHMRVHFKPNKEKHLLLLPHQNSTDEYRKIKKLKRSSFSLSPAAMAKPTCCLCRKDFPSLKSLFGHMRCHPERDWRGIQPPPSRNSEFSALSDDDDHHLLQVDSDYSAPTTPVIKKPVLDLSKSLSSGWAATGKRGRKACDLGFNGDSGTGSGLMELDEAVDDLMRLANGALMEYSTDVAENEKGKASSEAAGSVTTKSLKMKQHGLLMEDVEASSVQDDKLNHGSKSNICYKMMNMRKKKKKRRRLRDLEAVGNSTAAFQQSATSEKYKCSICSKTFPSYQALGGHKSYHNKNYITDSPPSSAASEEFLKLADDGDSDDDDDDQEQAKEAEENINGSSKMAITTHNYQSIIPMEGQSASSHVTSPGEAASRTCIKVHSFDLNELPFVEEEDGSFDSAAFRRSEHAYNSVNSQMNLSL